MIGFHFVLEKKLYFNCFAYLQQKLGCVSKWNMDTQHTETVDMPVIGKGAYGTVVACADDSVCEKLCPIEDSRDTVSMLRELAILYQLEHPNIVRLAGSVYQSGNKIVVPLQRATCDLLKIIRRYLVTEGLMMRCVQHVLAGMAFLHGAGVIHRDIKPSNVLYDAKDEMFRLCDFGLSITRGAEMESFDVKYGKLLSGDRTCLATCEVVTRWYRAPEVAVSPGLYDATIDVWACGCVFYELFRAASKPGVRGPDSVLFNCDATGGISDGKMNRKRRRDDQSLESPLVSYMASGGLIQKHMERGLFCGAIMNDFYGHTGLKQVYHHAATISAERGIASFPEQLAVLLPDIDQRLRRLVAHACNIDPCKRPSAASLCERFDVACVEPTELCLDAKQLCAADAGCSGRMQQTVNTTMLTIT